MPYLPLGQQLRRLSVHQGERISLLTDLSLAHSMDAIQYHWRSQQGVKQFTHEEAVMMSGQDPDFSKRDLYEHIEKGGDARWTMFVQVRRCEQDIYDKLRTSLFGQMMTPAEAASVDFDPFDVTKVWPRAQFPMHEVGELVLNRNPEVNHFLDYPEIRAHPW
jgi:catalase